MTEDIHITAVSRYISFAGVTYIFTRRLIDLYRSRRLIEWNHVNRVWQPAEDEATGDRTPVWLTILDLATELGDIPQEENPP